MVLALALIPLLAGCASPKDDLGNDGLVPDVQAPLALTDCREQIGIFPVTATQAAPYTPDGFGLMPPLPPDVFADADPTGTTATLLFVGFYCDNPQVTFLVPWFPAVPPGAMQVANASYHAVAGLPIAHGENLTAWLTAAGIPFVLGNVTQESPLETPVSITSAMVAASPSVSVRVDGTSPRMAADTPQELLPLFITQNREVVARLDLHISEHVHWQFGVATAQVTGFLQPSGPGLSTHSAPGMSIELVATPLPSA